MGRGTDVERSVWRLNGAAATPTSDRVVTEEPLGIEVNHDPFVVVMRTPGQDTELTAGFLFAERIVRGVADILALEVPPEGPEDDNRVDVVLGPEASERLQSKIRRTVASSSCGICGRRTIEQVQREAPPLTADFKVTPRLLSSLPDRLAAHQAVFDRTGGIHAAALFDAQGEVIVAREDVGRHNAVDKIVGWCLLKDRLPASETILMVSGRAGFEIVEKAVTAGIPVVCSVSAPSSLALELAEAAEVAVVGFLRGESMNVYTARRRIRAG